MLLPQIAALSRHLVRHPPTHLLVAAALGMKPTAEVEQQVKPETEDLNALFSAFRAAGGQVVGD